jgi:phosphoribosyl 1,2-cyclic phosphate phosphodiesterase
MTLTFLGTGTSIGVPAIGCDCDVCRSTDSLDKRLRSCAMIETDGGLRVLIDCGPDFRQQINRYPFEQFNKGRLWQTASGQPIRHFGKLDAVLLSHIHFDHVGGIDDLRPFAWFGDVDIYAKDDVIEGLHQTMPYCFRTDLYPGVPHLRMHEARHGEPILISRPGRKQMNIFYGGADLQGRMRNDTREIVIEPATDTLRIIPFTVMHGKLPIMGYRIGHLTYITDMKSLPDASWPVLEGTDTLVINALRFEKEHHSHHLVSDAVNVAQRIGARQTYLIHVTHDIGTHNYANSRLPEGIHFAYDQQQITIPNAD